VFLPPLQQQVERRIGEDWLLDQIRSRSSLELREVPARGE
jgi:hypothetical protein